MTDLIRQIAEESAQAPSGDNAQPWRFVIKGSQLYLYNIPGGDKTMYNFMERGSMISMGAVLENISIIAAQKGLPAKIEALPDAAQPSLAGIVTFTQAAPQPQNLYPFIAKRCTNRKPYRPESLPESFISKIKGLARDNVQVSVLDDREKISQLAGKLSLNERLILENYAIHQPLFSYIRWTSEEEEVKGDGMYIKTLELPPPAERAFKAFRNWKVISFLKHFGVTRLVAKDSAKLYKTSAAFCLLTIDSHDPTNYIAAGRVLQRIWLHATMDGVAVQPTAALFYLAARIEAGDASKFTPAQAQEIMEFERLAKEMFASTRKVAMMLRLGYADPPSAVSKKRKPEIKIEQ